MTGLNWASLSQPLLLQSRAQFGVGNLDFLCLQRLGDGYQGCHFSIQKRNHVDVCPSGHLYSPFFSQSSLQLILCLFLEISLHWTSHLISLSSPNEEAPSLSLSLSWAIEESSPLSYLLLVPTSPSSLHTASREVFLQQISCFFSAESLQRLPITCTVM